MWEFLARLGFSLLVLGVSTGTKALPLDVGWKIAALSAAYAFVAYVVDKRKLTNPGIAGLFAGLDCLAVSAALAYGGQLGSFGAVVAAPIVYAVSRRGSNPIAIGAIGAASIVSADGLVSNAALPSVAVFVQAALVVAVSVLANQPRVVVKSQSIQQMIAELAASESAAPQLDTSTQALIDLREKYRRLNTSFRELERKSRVARIASKLFLTRKKYSGNLDAIAEDLCELLEVKGVLIFVSNHSGDRMLVSASGGKVPSAPQTASFGITGKEAAAQIKQRAAEAIKAVSGSSAHPTQNVLLRRRGIVVGVLTVIADSAEKIEELSAKAEEIADVVSYIVEDERERQSLVRKAREANLLYQLACSLDGAITEADLGRRSAQALEHILEADHVGIWLLDGDRLIAIGRSGKPAPLMENYRNGKGVTGWLEEGSPKVLAYSVANSGVFDGRIGLRYRIGSFVAVPIKVGTEVIGLMSIGAMADGRLTSDDARTLVDIAAEFAHAVQSIRERKAQGSRHKPHGLLSLPEFQKEVTDLNKESACLVYIEPNRVAESEAEDSVTMEQITRQLSYLARQHAPHNAKLCRKSDGGVVVLLPELKYEDAEKWASELSAIAASRSVEIVGSEGVASLESRVRVADLSNRPEKKDE